MEEGGPIARTGFNYQDEIAVGFLLDMLEDPSILKVHCETHDDIVQVSQSSSTQVVAEYVQVKGSEEDKYWSVADLCVKVTGCRPNRSASDPVTRRALPARGEQNAKMAVDYACGRRTLFPGSDEVGWENLCGVPGVPTRSS